MHRKVTITCPYFGAPRRDLAGAACEFGQTPFPPVAPTEITFEVMIHAIGSNRSAVRKVVADWTGRALPEAGRLLDNVDHEPTTVSTDADEPSARLLLNALTRAGATARVHQAGASTHTSEIDPRVAHRLRFDVVLHDPGAQRILVIHALRTTIGLSLAEARELVDAFASRPSDAVAGRALTLERATIAVDRLTAAGATASLVPSG